MATCICAGTPLVCMVRWDTIPESFLLIATTFFVLALARHPFGGTVSQAEGVACGERVLKRVPGVFEEKLSGVIRKSERTV